MVKLELKDPLHIQINTENISYLTGLREFFSAYVEGFRFMPQFQFGGWNGKVCLFNSSNRTLPYGLITDLIRYTKKDFPLEQIDVDTNISSLFKCVENPKITQKLKFKLRPYQTDCVLTALKYGRGIIKVATASGKSFIIANIINELKVLGKIKKSLIIVPTTNLVQQFRDDLIDYGFDVSRIGRLYSEFKELNNEILISTWQSLMTRHEILKNYDCVIGDECHTHKAKEVHKILKDCSSAKIRIGFTGTLPVSKLNMWQIQGYMGPVLKEYTASDLAKLGFVSECVIDILNVKYTQKYKGEYHDIKDSVFQSKFRLNIVKEILSKVDSNILVLVSKVEKEGQFLKDYLSSVNFTDKEVVFVSGQTKVADRDYWRFKLETRKDIVLIATYPIFSMGVNIPSLKYILLASPVKSNIRVLQSVGRALRIHVDKVNGSKVFDIVDMVKYLNSHGDKRIKYYSIEGFDIVEHNINEKDYNINTIHNIFPSGDNAL